MSCSPQEDLVAGDFFHHLAHSPLPPDFSGVPGAASPVQPVPVHCSHMVLTGLQCPPCSLQLSQQRSPFRREGMPSCAHPQGISLPFWSLPKVEEVAALFLGKSSADQQVAQSVTSKTNESPVSGLLNLPTEWAKVCSFLHSMT